MLEGQPIRTGVDRLLDLLKNVDKISIHDASKTLKIPLSTLQSWIDFLVEENIIGIEYNFTVPFIYLNKPPEESLRNEVVEVKSQKATLKDFYQEFKRRGLEKKIPIQKIEDFWREKLFTTLNKEKEFFYREARKRGFNDDKIEKAWKDYKARILMSLP